MLHNDWSWLYLNDNDHLNEIGIINQDMVPNIPLNLQLLEHEKAGLWMFQLNELVITKMSHGRGKKITDHTLQDFFNAMLIPDCDGSLFTFLNATVLDFLWQIDDLRETLTMFMQQNQIHELYFFKTVYVDIHGQTFVRGIGCDKTRGCELIYNSLQRPMTSNIFAAAKKFDRVIGFEF